MPKKDSRKKKTSSTEMAAGHQSWFERVQGVNFYADAYRLVRDTGIELNRNLTAYDSKMINLNTDLTQFVKHINAATDPAEVSSIISNMLAAKLRDAAPIVFQTFLLGKNLQTKIHNYFNSIELLPHVDEPSDEDLEKYLKEVKAFRDHFPEFEVPEAETARGPVERDIRVGKNAVGLMQMLKHMDEKRQSGMKKESQSGKAIHAEEVLKWLTLMDHDTEATFSFPAIRKQPGLKWEKDDEGVWQKKEDGHVLMLSTALASLKQRKVPNITRMINEAKKSSIPEVAEMFKTADKESAGIIENEKAAFNDQNSEYRSQKANIDPIFLTFYIIYKKMKLSVDQFYSFQRIIYSLGRRMLSKKKIQDYLMDDQHRTIPGVADFLIEIMPNPNLHTAPWRLTHHRIQDMIAVVGGVCAKCYRMSVSEPGFSWRYFAGMKTTQTVGLTFILNLWGLETNSGVVFPISEKMFQQYMIGRKAPIGNTNFMIGNFSKVRILQ